MFAATTPSEAQLKTQARLLKTFLADKGTPLSHTTCLEAVATLHGHKSWHHAQAACQHQNDLLQTHPSALLQAAEHEVAVLLQTLHAQLDARITPQVLRCTGMLPSVTAYNLAGVDDATMDVVREYAVHLRDGSRLAASVHSTFSLRHQIVVLETQLHVSRTAAGHGEPDDQGRRKGDMDDDLMEYVDSGPQSLHMHNDRLPKELARHLAHWPDARLLEMLTDVAE